MLTLVRRSSFILFPVANQYSLGEERACLSYAFMCIAKGSQGRELKQDSEAEITEEHCFLVCLPAYAQRAFLDIPSPPAQGMVPPTVGCVLLY